MSDPRPTHTSWDGSPARPFKIDVADAVLDDLRARLLRTR